MEQAEDRRRGFALMLKELISLHGDASLSKSSSDQSARFDRVLSELMAERERSVVATALLKQQEETGHLLRTQQEEFQRERKSNQDRQDELMLKMAKQQSDFQLRQQKQQEEFQAKLEQREERLQERLEHERREHNLKQDKLLARQDELIARHDQERVEAKASQEVLLHKILDNQRILPPRDENQEGVILEQGRQQIYFREVIQQLQEEVKTLRHSESGKSKNCQGRVMLKQPGDANRFRSSFDSIHSWRS